MNEKTRHLDTPGGRTHCEKFLYFPVHRKVGVQPRVSWNPYEHHDLAAIREKRGMSGCPLLQDPRAINPEQVCQTCRQLVENSLGNSG